MSNPKPIVTKTFSFEIAESRNSTECIQLLTLVMMSYSGRLSSNDNKAIVEWFKEQYREDSK